MPGGGPGRGDSPSRVGRARGQLGGLRGNSEALGEMDGAFSRLSTWNLLRGQDCERERVGGEREKGEGPAPGRWKF
jgi:hypothetical protein